MSAYNAFKQSVGWDVYISDDDEDGPRHIIPSADMYQHECSEDCPCGPTLTEEGDWLHNAWDEREQYEDGMRRPH